jgi:hypothetical protein
VQIAEVEQPQRLGAWRANLLSSKLERLLYADLKRA